MTNNNTNIAAWVGTEMYRPFLLFTLLFILVACDNSDTLQQADSKHTVNNSGQVEIFRDQYGTPHVFADSNYGVYYGYGYVVATDRLFQMEMLKRTVHGRVAEVLGEEFLDLDTLIRTSYDHRAVRKQLDDLAPEDREILEAYAQVLAKEFKKY